MIEPTEESKAWVARIVSELKKGATSQTSTSDDKKAQYVSQKVLPTAEMAKMLKHRCQGKWNLSWQKVHPKKGVESYGVKPLVKLGFKCTECKETEDVCLYYDGSIVIGQQTKKLQGLSAMDNLNSGSCARQVMNGRKREGQYEEEIDPKEIIMYENPAKFTKESEWEQFQKYFPSLQPAQIQRLRDGTKKKGRCRYLFNPGNSGFLKPILPLIKKIAGCEVTLKHHQATERSFSELEDHEKLVSFKLSCR